MITESRTGAVGPALYAIEQSVGRLFNTARVDNVFGQPIERGDMTIIPCAEVMIGLGMGGGPNLAQDKNTPGVSEGVGGGGGARGRPVAVIVMTPDEVQVKPIINVTRVVGAIFSTIGSALLLLRAFTQPRRVVIIRRGGLFSGRARGMRARGRRQWWRM
jgi:uncharacterized spore protein YtfJ